MVSKKEAIQLEALDPKCVTEGRVVTRKHFSTIVRQLQMTESGSISGHSGHVT